jgi:hypothetical protein
MALVERQTLTFKIRLRDKHAADFIRQTAASEWRVEAAGSTRARNSDGRARSSKAFKPSAFSKDRLSRSVDPTRLDRRR